jgi:hypothetical protein
MKAEEFRALSEKFGKKHIAPLGFEFRKGDWFYHDDRFHLAVLPFAGRWEIGFRVKRVTLAFAHADVKTVDGTQPSPFDRDLFHYPLRIAPSLLAPLIQSDYSPSVWHYSFPDERFNVALRFDSIFYGGFGLQILKDPKSTRAENDEVWKENLARFGVEYISEEEATNRVENLFRQVGAHCMEWAEWFTHPRVVSQLKNFPDKDTHWFEQKLLCNYQAISK